MDIVSLQPIGSVTQQEGVQGPDSDTKKKEGQDLGLVIAVIVIVGYFVFQRIMNPPKDPALCTCKSLIDRNITVSGNNWAITIAAIVSRSYTNIPGQFGHAVIYFEVINDFEYNMFKAEIGKDDGGKVRQKLTLVTSPLDVSNSLNGHKTWLLHRNIVHPVLKRLQNENGIEINGFSIFSNNCLDWAKKIAMEAGVTENELSVNMPTFSIPRMI